jgi:hypothetical protein
MTVSTTCAPDENVSMLSLSGFLCCLTTNEKVLAVPTVLSVPFRMTVIWRSRPANIFIASDDTHDLLVGVWSSEDHRVGSGEVTIVAAIGSGSIVLSKDCQGREEQELAGRADRWMHVEISE